MSSITLAGEIMSDGYVFYGDSPATVVITIDTSADIANCEFQNATVVGVLDGNNIFRQCALQDLTYTNGFIFQCALFGTITLGGGAAWILDCYSGIPGTIGGTVPWIDMGGSGNTLALRGYDGGIGIKNSTGSGAINSLDMNSGFVQFDSTVTGNQFVVHGVAEILDNSVGATITDHTVNTSVDGVRKGVFADRVLTDGDTNNLQIIDPDDGTTVLMTKSVKNKSGGAIVMPADAPAEERS
jgi:hypothetical protein